MMWTAKPPSMTPDQYFIYKAQLVAFRFRVEVYINFKDRTAEFQTEDEATLNKIYEALEAEL